MRSLLLLISMLSFLACRDNNAGNSKNTDLNDTKHIYTQKDMQNLIIPLLKAKGEQFVKYKMILAREAEAGEEIQTITNDGLETTNKANEGDYMVKNQTEAGEMYILDAAKFQKRYQLAEKRKDGFDLYKPTGKIVALEMTADILSELQLPDTFHFTAAWGSDMIVKQADYLASPPDYSEVYRIARKEFFETYKEDGR